MGRGGNEPIGCLILGAWRRRCRALWRAQTEVFAPLDAPVAAGAWKRNVVVWYQDNNDCSTTGAPTMTDDDIAEAFALGNIAPADFDHRAHLRAAFCLARRQPFLEACVAMRDGLQDLARRAGRPGLYHETITVAFMSIVAQRVASRPELAWDDFFAAHPDLMDRALLGRWYGRETLESAQARAQFVLPDAGAA